MDDYHALTRYQAWGQETLHWAEKGKFFEGEITIRFSFRRGELMDTRAEGVSYRISASRIRMQSSSENSK